MSIRCVLAQRARTIPQCQQLGKHSLAAWHGFMPGSKLGNTEDTLLSDAGPDPQNRPAAPTPQMLLCELRARTQLCALAKLRHRVTALQALDLRVTILSWVCEIAAYPLKLLMLRCDDRLMATVSVSKVKQRCLG